MIFSSFKEINRLIIKGMSNIYLKLTIEKNWRSQNVDFLSSSPGHFLGSSSSSRYHWSLKLLVATPRPKVWEQKVVCGFSIVLILTEIWKTACFLLNQNKSLKKNETELKMQNLTYKFRQRNLVLHLI